MTNRKALIVMLAALLVACAGPVSAKSKAKAQQSSQTQSAKKQGTKDCKFVTPPFMRNPRFMNRGFFKANKCRKLKE